MHISRSVLVVTLAVASLAFARSSAAQTAPAGPAGPDAPPAIPPTAQAVPDAPADEREAIMAVIRGESAAFWNKDFDAWAKHWVHAPYVRMLGWWEAGGISVTEGWEALSRGTKRAMEESPEPNPTANQVRRENVNIRVLGDMAWVTFDQYGIDSGDPRMDMPGLSRETRVLEKHDGRWRIVYVGWLLEGPAAS